MARAVPNVMPVLIVSNLYDIFISLAISLCPLFHYKAILCSGQITQQTGDNRSLFWFIRLKHTF